MLKILATHFKRFLIEIGVGDHEIISSLIILFEVLLIMYKDQQKTVGLADYCWYPRLRESPLLFRLILKRTELLQRWAHAGYMQCRMRAITHARFQPYRIGSA
jgi:hypothetical protein